jgi:di/tricarboxylate transporter
MAVITAPLMGRPRTALEAQARAILPVAGLSAFVNNTPIVAMFLPVLRELSDRTGVAASRLFMPLSFAAILGGVCTLIGTSTNLVTQGLIIETLGAPDPPRGLAPFGMWTLAWVGVPVALAGLGYILLFGRRLLPDRGGPRVFPGAARQYMTAMRVAPDSPVVGRTIEQAGLRHLPGLFLSRIDREEATIVAVAPDEALRAGDTLVFVGVLDSVVDLQRIKGLVPVADETAPDRYRPRLKLIEAVVSPGSPLVGRSIRDSGIRTGWGAVVIAVHRHGEQVRGKIGDIVLRPGDTLLLESDPGFARRYRNSANFTLVSEVEGAAAPRHERAGIALAVLAAMVLAMTFDWLDHTVAVFVAAALMVLTRCCTAGQARAGVDWPVLLTIGASFGVARAMEKTGLAGGVAEEIVRRAGGLGPWGLLAAVYAVTLLFTTLVSNNAAVALVFPIALSVAREAGLNFTPLAVAIAVAASCEFTTPLGYQTNLMVMGPGGYRWTDYLRFGSPLTLLTAAVSIALIPLVYGL